MLNPMARFAASVLVTLWAGDASMAGGTRTDVVHAQHAAPITIETIVTDSDGMPVSGAVLFTNLGGQAISDAAGRARLALEVPNGTSEVHLSAAWSHAGINHIGTRRIELTAGWDAHHPAASVPFDAGTITMQANGDCEPHWVPGFGVPGLSNAPRVFAVFDDGLGGGPALYAGGDFTIAGGITVNRIAKWDGTEWSSLGSGMNNPIQALAVFDDRAGGGPALYAGGLFTSAGGVAANRIAKWNGVTWSPLGSGTNGLVYALAAFDDGLGGGSALYAGGMFTTAGGVITNHIARWDGHSWSALGSGLNDWVRALIVFDDGSDGGPALYVGGFFTAAGALTVNRIAKWDGTAWSRLGSGMSTQVYVLSVFDDGLGGGPVLYAGGNFTVAGGVTVNHIARWDGIAWSALGSGTNSSVVRLTAYDDGSSDRPALYVGGQFTTAGSEPANNIARWDGSEWSTLGSGLNSVVWALAVYDDGSGSGPALYVGGFFSSAGGMPADSIAKWQGCRPSTKPCLEDVDGDGVVDLSDVTAMIAAWGFCAGCAEDVNGDDVVNLSDLLEVLAAWGTCS